MRHLFATLLILCLAAGGCGAAVLVMSTNGTYTTKATLAAASTDADTVGKTIVITSPQTVTTGVHLHTNRGLRVEPGGAIIASGSGFANISSPTVNTGTPFSTGVTVYDAAGKSYLRSQTATNADSATNATNATNATSAADSGLLNGKKWVSLASGSTGSVPGSSTISFSLYSSSKGYNYRTSVYPTSGSATTIWRGYVPLTATDAYYQIFSVQAAGGKDSLKIFNCTGGNSTFTYSVDVWK